MVWDLMFALAVNSYKNNANFTKHLTWIHNNIKINSVN
jgi:hypothetical protein